MTLGTGAISVQDACNEIIGTQTSLQDCVNDACHAGFNGTYYTAPATSLAEFRGYNDALCSTNLTISPTSTLRTSAAGSFTLTVTVTGGSVSWSGSDDQTWITLSGTTTGTTSGSFTVNYTANSSGGTRFGNVTVSWSPGPNRVCVVAQQSS